MRDLSKNLVFNGNNITFVLIKNEWWIPIKPICTALGIDYGTQAEKMKEHKILSQLCGVHLTVAADGKMRNMLCLPEKFIYGWMFSINSDNEKLVAYQMECYDVLYKHFHGKMTERMNLLTEKIDNIQTMEQLKSNEVMETYKFLESRNKKLDRMLKGLDQDLITGQYAFDLKTEDK